MLGARSVSGLTEPEGSNASCIDLKLVDPDNRPSDLGVVGRLFGRPPPELEFDGEAVGRVEEVGDPVVFEGSKGPDTAEAAAAASSVFSGRRPVNSVRAADREVAAEPSLESE